MEISDTQMMGECIASGATAEGQATLDVVSPRTEPWTVTASTVITGFGKSAVFLTNSTPASFLVPAGASGITLKFVAPSNAWDTVCNCGDLTATAVVSVDVTTSSGVLHAVSTPVHYHCAI